MRAIVLVGGFGTRLRPLTLSVPKPMLPVGHVTIIERLITNLARGGVDQVTLALGFKPEPFVAAFPSGRCAGVELSYAVEPEPLDTAGAIRFAADAVGVDDTFVVANGDVLTDLNVAELAAFHRSRGAEATLHLISVADPSSFGVVALDSDGRVERFVEKPPPGTAPSTLINAGTYVLEPSVLDRITPGARVSIERATFPAIVADGGVYAMASDDYWVDTGRPDLYLQANLDMLAGKRRFDSCDAVHPHATVSPDANVSNSVVSAGAVVESGAVVTGSVLLPGSVVGARAVVTDSVLMGSVGAGASVVDVVLGANASVAAGEQVAHLRRPSPDS